MPTNGAGPHGEMRVLRSELLEAHRELNKLRTQNEQLIGSNKGLSELLITTEKRAGECLKLLVAFRRLVEAEDCPAALRGIEEIVINIIGCENFVVLLITDTDVLRVVAGMGPIVDRTYDVCPTYEEIESEALRMVPLFIDTNVVGAIALQELLPHRESLDSNDEQVLQLLSKHAATVVMAAQHQKFWTKMKISEVA